MKPGSVYPELFWLSDPHFGHENIIEYSKRPFKTVSEMDKTIIDNINSTVPENAHLLILGDFCFGPRSGKKFAQVAEQYVRQIRKKRRLTLILGNHDRDDDPRFTGLFDQAVHIKILKVHPRFIIPGYVEKPGEQIRNHKIVNCHYALRHWPGDARGAWNLHGHSHGELRPDPNIKAFQFDVCVENNDYRPYSLKQLVSRANQFYSRIGVSYNSPR